MAGKVGRPMTGVTYSANLVKVANERLRAMQKKYKNASMSASFRNIERYYERGGEKGSIYSHENKQGRDRGYLGFKTYNKKEWASLSVEQKKYYNAMLNQFLENQTSTKIGIEQAYKDAYNTFIKDNPNMSDLTYGDYKELWKTYHDNVKPAKGDYLASDRIMTLIEHDKFNMEMLTGSQAEETLKFLRGTMSPREERNFLSKFDKPDFNTGKVMRREGNQGSRPATMADSAPRRPRNF